MFLDEFFSNLDESVPNRNYHICFSKQSIAPAMTFFFLKNVFSLSFGKY